MPTTSWWARRKIDERQAELRIEPITSDGFMHISFTKPVKLPEDVHKLIMEQKLVDVTFEPSTYDFEVIEG